MIKDKELRDGRQIRFRDGEGITLEVIRELLSDEADKNAVPVAFRAEQVKFGGLIGGSVENALVLFHPEHERDYFNYVLRVTRQGRYAFLNVDMTGVSKMSGKVYAATEGRKEAKAERRGMAMSEKIGHAIGSGIANGIMSIGASKSKLEQEENWYTMVNDIFDDVVG